MTTTGIADSSQYTLREEADRIEVQLDLSTIAGVVSPGEEFEIQITTSSGASTYIEARIPSTAESGGTVEV